MTSQTKSSDFFFVNECVLAAARGVGRGRFRGKGGHLLLPPHPPTALPRQCYEHTLVKKVTRFCLAHLLWKSRYNRHWHFTPTKELPKTGVSFILWSENKTPVSGEFRCETETGVVRTVYWLFFKIDQCSVTSIESYHRDLLNDVAEHRSTLKNNQNT